MINSLEIRYSTVRAIRFCLIKGKAIKRVFFISRLNNRECRMVLQDPNLSTTEVLVWALGSPQAELLRQQAQTIWAGRLEGGLPGLDSLCSRTQTAPQLL